MFGKPSLGLLFKQGLADKAKFSKRKLEMESWPLCSEATVFAEAGTEDEKECLSMALQIHWLKHIVRALNIMPSCSK